jgi:hypothetical protein
MNETEFNYCINRTNRILYFLEKKSAQKSNICNRISQVVSKFFLNVLRLFNYLFGDHRWYDEAKARAIVRYYTTQFPAEKKNEKLSAKVSKIQNFLNPASIKAITTSSRTESRNPNETPPQFGPSNSAKPLDPIPVPVQAQDEAKPVEAPDSSATSKSEKQKSFRFYSPYGLPNPDPETGFAFVDPPVPVKLQHAQLKRELKPVLPVQQAAPLKDLTGHQFHLITQNRPNLDIRTLFQLHANEFGANSSLEGNYTLDSINFLHAYLIEWENIHKHPAVAKFIKKLSFAKQVAELLEKQDLPAFTKALQEGIEESCKTKESLLIQGGWIGTPSHAMWYEFMPESSTLRIYNTGEGIQNSSRGLHGVKTKFQPFVDWEGIDPKKLSSPVFLKALYELNCPTKKMKKNQLNKKYPMDLKIFTQALKIFSSPKKLYLLIPFY